MMRSIFVIAMIGCGTPTSSLRALIELKEIDTRLFVSAAFFDGDADHEVADGRVVARFREHDFAVDRERSRFGAFIELDTPLVVDEPITVSVTRDGGDAPDSTITVPPAVQVDAFPVFASRSADFTFSWSPVSDDLLTWEMQGFCANGAATIPPGTGSATIAANTVGPPDGGTCTAQFQLSRHRTGSLDPAFAEGVIGFERFFFTELASTP